MAQSLNNLAELYRVQSKYTEAAPLYQRSLTIIEKALGPAHPNVAQGLENYASLLRATNRSFEAAPLEARAKAIRDKAAGAQRSLTIWEKVLGRIRGRQQVSPS